ncbi:hypothetical protein ACFLRQ_03175, partial [Bacteroidota bacterium]
MKKNTKNVDLFKLSFLLFLLFLLVPIIIFLIYFNKQVISTDINDWGQFGSYFGGILTPIISVLSLIILVNIYLKLGKDESFEKWRLYRNQMKHEAYIELHNYSLSIFSAEDMIANSSHLVSLNISLNTSNADIANSFKDFIIGYGKI